VTKPAVFGGILYTFL